MNQLTIQKYTPAKQLLLTLLIVLASFLIFMFVGSVLTALFFNINLIKDASSLDASSANANIEALKFLQTIYSFGLFVIPSLILAYLFSRKISSYLYLTKKPKLRLILLAIGITIFALPTINFLGEWNTQLHLPSFLSDLEELMKQSEQKAQLITQKFLVMHSISDLAVNLFVIAIIPALGEELLFRGVIQQVFARMTGSKHWAIWITAFLFSALHLQFFGFFPRMLMGVLFGYMLVWSGNLWLPIIAHLTNNGMAVIVTYLIGEEHISKEVEQFGSNQFGGVIFSVLVVALFMLIFLRISKRQR